MTIVVESQNKAWWVLGSSLTCSRVCRTLGIGNLYLQVANSQETALQRAGLFILAVFIRSP